MDRGSILSMSSDRARLRAYPDDRGGVPCSGTQGIAGNGCASRALRTSDRIGKEARLHLRWPVFALCFRTLPSRIE